jgi:uncharacterized membrane protein
MLCPVPTGGNRNAATLLLVFLNFYCLCVDGRDTLFPIFKQHGQKSNMFDFLSVLPEFLAILLPTVWTLDRSPLLLKSKQQPANQRAALCFGFVLLFLLLYCYYYYLYSYFCYYYY